VPAKSAVGIERTTAGRARCSHVKPNRIWIEVHVEAAVAAGNHHSFESVLFGVVRRENDNIFLNAHGRRPAHGAFRPLSPGVEMLCDGGLLFGRKHLASCMDSFMRSPPTFDLKLVESVIH